jgi:ubiquinone/menaquinone biosynthesis C-methylase UbiE
MKSISGIDLDTVRTVYSGPERVLWELVMGQQIHIGGFQSSMDLATRAEIQEGSEGVDLCCCTGAGMRFLVRFCGAARMQGVDATREVIELGRTRCEAEGLADKIAFTLADVCESGLPDAGFDFVWGEDAWCYVLNKSALITEAVRLVKSGGTIAFTDWVEGDRPMTAEEGERLLRFMKFLNIQDVHGYSTLLVDEGCEVVVAEDTGRFAPCVDLYLMALEKQYTYDALSILGFDMNLLQSMAAEMKFMQDLAHEGKIIQGIFVARKG